MGLLSNTGLLASITPKPVFLKQKSAIELRCDVTPAPFMLRPYAGLYNPFSHACSVLCNHPADIEARDVVKRAKDSWIEGKSHFFQEDLSKFQDGGGDKEKNRTPHDIVTEDMFRRYAETDSRPLTPAPTLASGKSRGSRRCLTPDQPHQRTTIVLDLRRSHSQETIYYHGYTTSDITGGHNTSPTNDRSTLPSLNLSDGAHNRLIKGQCEQLPPLASPLVLSKRTIPVKEPQSVRTARKNQLKALNLGKPAKQSKNNNKPEPAPVSQRSKAEKESNEANDANGEEGGSGEGRRRGKRRKKGRQGGSDRMTSAGLAAQAQQDPETQIAEIVTDSQNPSSRGSIAPSQDDDIIPLPVIKPLVVAKKTDSFLDDDILKYLHREVDEEAIETEFDVKRRYVLEEAMRTRPERAHGQEMQKLLRELKVPAVSLGDWLHIPRVFSRQNAQFSLPLDTNALETLTPMTYAARFVTLKKSKQLLYLTVLRKFRPQGYRMPIKNLEEGLIMMMGGSLNTAQAKSFKTLMDWETYEEEESIPDEIKVTLLDGYKRPPISTEVGDNGESDEETIKYRTWCGLCAICERMHGRYPSRDKDPPDGIELSDFSMVETKLATLRVHDGLREILNTIRER
ncbi:uncharacterized protein LOC113502149 [Trichoplusia ni]|uniref:Uncharacterized protein LOC113502149 n=1 Tax=Trichoplusia ni TaxID=7111 RepID=A0A7E5WF76_TRINI|nr:uncharacterized protein LOC113502149 [Trichoplusia ni]XP_026739351.1 uncharacterized protein LOC113502149 [Trichoplusia ni]XP_026739352.1 uncharacterized protein LOC113502149 [Trichoplusia ni]